MYVNPDGPEAAAVIESLVEALEGTVSRFANVPDHLAMPWLRTARNTLAKVSRT